MKPSDAEKAISLSAAKREEAGPSASPMRETHSAPAAMAEEDAHQSPMDTLLDQMTSARDQMMGGGMMGSAATYTCPTMSQP